MSGESSSLHLLRAYEERNAIVAKYDFGRETGAEIDDWEDPKLELYHTQDRYGFIHDKRLPDSSNSNKNENDPKISIEVERTLKWAEMFKKEKNFFVENAKYREKMINRVYKGVPDSVRGRLWHTLLDIEKVKSEQEGKYREMRDRARKHSPDIRQIDLDVNRTYRNHTMFRERYNSRQVALFHVLAAYSIYNSEIGYCQGMSQVAALLLMYLNEEEDVFWALHKLMVNPKYQMHGFYIQGFPKLLRFQAHHEKILKKFVPKLKKHLDKNGIDTGIYTLKWFFQCFLDRIPFSLTLRVWDLFILEGDRVLVAMAYNILKMHRRYLMSLGMDEIIEHLQINMEKDFGYHDDATIEKLRETMHELRSQRLDSPSGRTPSSELPQKPFGMMTFRNSIEREVGVRSGRLTDREREFSEHTLQRQLDIEKRMDLEPSFEEGPSDEETTEKSSISNLSSPSTLPLSLAQEKLDESLRLLLTTANMNGTNSQSSSKSNGNVKRRNVVVEKEENTSDSFTSTNKDQVVRIHVPYDSHSDAILSSSESSARYEGNKVYIPVNSEFNSSFSHSLENRFEKTYYRSTTTTTVVTKIEDSKI